MRYTKSNKMMFADPQLMNKRREKWQLPKPLLSTCMAPWKFSGKESKGGEVFFDHVCYTSDAFKMSLKRSESKEYSS